MKPSLFRLFTAKLSTKFYNRQTLASTIVIFPKIGLKCETESQNTT